MSAVAEMLRKPVDAGTNFPCLLQHAPVGFALCDSKGTIAARNSAFDELLGITGSQSQNSLAELIHSEDIDLPVQLSDLFQGARDEFQVQSHLGGAEDRLLRWSIWIPEREVPEPENALVMVEDLSSFAVARRYRHQAERLETVGRLAGGVAHDFNNLLTGVLLYCDLLIAAIEPEHRARKYAEEIRSAGLHASGLVRQLLSVARSNTSAPRPISLNEVAEGMQDLLMRLIGENIRLQLRLDPDLGLVRMDPVHVQQILLNLVLNARDALARGGQISVETRNCKVQALSQSALQSADTPCLSCALFAVEDNGEGMDQSVRAHLFEPFFTTKAGKGTGIGLATVHDIVSSNGGLIHVRSELNRGTRISVLLPLIANSNPVSLEQTSFHSTHNGEVPSFQIEEPIS